MRHFALVAAASFGLLASLFVAAGAVCAQATPAEIALQMAGHPPEDLDDYFAVKQRLGDSGVRDVQSELSKLAYKEAGLAFGVRFSGCRFPDWFYRANAGFELARASSDSHAWQDNLASINAAAARREDIRGRVIAGEAVDPVYAAAAGAYQRGKAEGDRRKAELARRVGDDQFQRADIGMVSSQTLWAAGVPARLGDYFREAQTGEMCRTDRANTDWLKADLAAQGWPKISVYGPQADNDAWLLVQHADHDIDFQKSVLVLLEGLLPTKDTMPQSYAYLYDRVAVADKRPQRFGTQGRCTGPAQWEPFTSEDPENLDKRRAEVGLGSEAEYIQMFTFCTAEIAVFSGG